MFTVQDGGSPLGIAAQQGHTQTVQRLLEARARVNYQDTKVITIVNTVATCTKSTLFLFGSDIRTPSSIRVEYTYVHVYVSIITPLRGIWHVYTSQMTKKGCYR